MFVCTPAHAHVTEALRALTVGADMFVEKPLVLEIDHARQVRAKLNQKTHLKISSNLILSYLAEHKLGLPRSY